jgi:uncharacterized protein (TIGR02466 family)
MPAMKGPVTLADAERRLAAGDWEGAVAAARTRLADRPGDADTLFLLAEALVRGRKPARALEAIQRLPRAEADSIRRWMLEGRARNNLGQFKLAEKAFRRSVELEPANAQAHSNLGHVVRSLRRREEAEGHLRRAVELDPRLTRALQSLADIRLADGDAAEAVRILRQALGAKPGDPGLLGHLGAALHRSRDFSGAEQAYREALAAHPGHAEAWLNLGITLQETGRLEKATAAYVRAVSAAPGSVAARIHLAEALLARGEPESALAEIERGQRIDPGHPSLLADRALALLGLDRTEEAAALLDVSRLVMCVDLEPPPAYASIGAFNEALADHLLVHPTLAYEPEGHATRRGRHTGNLLDDDKGPLAHLEQAVQAAANRYLKELGPEPGHPFPGTVPKRHQLTMWAVVMETAGHQLPHIHPAAWLSGVYYVELPASLGDGESGQEGWIEFGLPPEELRTTAAPPLTAFQPAAGRMFLFPSYFYHRTLPFAGPHRRISIAFDLLRKPAG